MSYPVAPLPDVNARQVAQVIRPPSTSLLTIDSEDRFETYTQASAAGSLPASTLNATPYYFAIRKRESLMNGFFTRIGVSEVVFPLAIPNINVKTSIMKVIWSGSSSGTGYIVLNDGFYKPSALAAAVQTAIQNIPGSGGVLAGVTFTYGQNKKPSFQYDTNNPALEIAFFPVDYDSIGGAGPDYPFPPTTKQLFHLLGFSDLNSTANAVGASGYTFCQFTRYIDICCFQLTNNQALKDQTSQTVARDMLARVYLGDALIPGDIDVSSADFCPPGCAPITLYKNYTSPKQIQWIPNQPIPGYLQFQVFDDTGANLYETMVQDPLDPALDEISGYLDWSMTMLVSEN